MCRHRKSGPGTVNQYERAVGCLCHCSFMLPVKELSTRMCPYASHCDAANEIEFISPARCKTVRRDVERSSNRRSRSMSKPRSFAWRRRTNSWPHINHLVQRAHFRWAFFACCAFISFAYHCAGAAPPQRVHILMRKVFAVAKFSVQKSVHATRQAHDAG